MGSQCLMRLPARGLHVGRYTRTTGVDGVPFPGTSRCLIVLGLLAKHSFKYFQILSSTPDRGKKTNAEKKLSICVFQLLGLGAWGFGVA